MVAAELIDPLVTESLELAEDDMTPSCTGLSAVYGWKRYLCSVAVTACLTKHLFGRRPSLLKALVTPGIFFGVGILAEYATRYIASRLLQRRAAAVQRRALLTDVESDFKLVVPHELMREERIGGSAKVWKIKASFGVTSIWLRRLRHRGWTWTTDLKHWQSVQQHRSSGGMTEGLLPVRSNRWLLRRLHMRDVRDRVRPPRAAHAPPPLCLPADLEDSAEEAPADFVCPIKHTVMTDPVVGPAGVSYERAALLQWLRRRQTDPSTQGALEASDLYANLNLRSMIATWAKAQNDRLDNCCDCGADGASGGTSEVTRTEPTVHATRAHPPNKKKPAIRKRLPPCERRAPSVD